MLFITAADTGFYFFLPYMVGQIERLFPKARLIVYDLGMTEQETLQLNEWGVETKKWHISPGWPVEKPNYFPRALHKPSMILDALENNPNETAVYLDADAIPNKSFSVPTGCDVAVSMVDQEALTILDSKPEVKYNGIFNTGVMLFGRSKRRLAFVREWSDRLSESEKTESDQRIAWVLLEEMEGFNRKEYDVTNVLSVRGENVKVRVLRDTTWNLFALRAHFFMGKKRIHPDGANVLHFKGHSMHNPSDFRNCMKMGQMPLVNQRSTPVLKKPLVHIVVLRCPTCKERFQTEASKDGKYQCPHCDGWMEYIYHKPDLADAKPIGPSENK